MKKLFAFLLVMTLALSFSACGKKKEKNAENKVDLEYYAELGQMPECPYKLGADPDEMVEKLTAAESSAEAAGDEYPFAVTEGEKTVRIDNGDFVYYYEKANKDKGISYIIATSKGYGFGVGTSILEIKNALPELEYTEEDANDDNSFFLMGTMGGTVLKYTFKTRVISFFFSENELTAVTLYDTDNWTE